MYPRLLDPKLNMIVAGKTQRFLDKLLKTFLSLSGFENLIHKKGALNRSLSGSARAQNLVNSATKACAENDYFPSVSMRRDGKLKYMD